MTNTADAQPRPFSPAEVAFLVGVPLLSATG